MANYKTTIIGIVMAVLMAMQTYDGSKGWKGYAMAAAMAIFGFMAKDFNVTGGTVTNTK